MRILTFSLACFLLSYPVFSSAQQISADSPACRLFTQIKSIKQVDKVKQLVGTQYKLDQVGTTYRWGKTDGYYIDATFFSDGRLRNSFGKPSVQMKQVLDRFDVKLTDFESVLGPGTVAGALYQITISDSSFIMFQTNDRNEIFFRFSTNVCPQ